MTPEEKVQIEHRLTEVEARSKSNTKRLDEHDEAIEKNTDLIGSIKELAVETKHMREDLNKTVSRLDKLENRDGDKWEKFKWLIVSGLVPLVLGFLAAYLGLK